MGPTNHSFSHAGADWLGRWALSRCGSCYCYGGPAGQGKVVNSDFMAVSSNLLDMQSTYNYRRGEKGVASACFV